MEFLHGANPEFLAHQLDLKFLMCRFPQLLLKTWTRKKQNLHVRKNPLHFENRVFFNVIKETTVKEMYGYIVKISCQKTNFEQMQTNFRIKGDNFGFFSPLFCCCIKT